MVSNLHHPTPVIANSDQFQMLVLSNFWHCRFLPTDKNNNQDYRKLSPLLEISILHSTEFLSLLRLKLPCASRMPVIPAIEDHRSEIPLGAERVRPSIPSFSDLDKSRSLMRE